MSDRPGRSAPSIGALGEADVEEVAAVSAACFARPWTAGELLAEASRAGSLVRVARLDGRVRAYAVVRTVLDEGELLSIGVAPEVRRRGVGRALLEAVLDEAASRGAAWVHLEVRADDPAAAALYRGVGFVEVGRRSGYYPDGADAALMTRAARGRTPPPARG